MLKNLLNTEVVQVVEQVKDWREAVAAGATIVRIGRALFDDAFEGPAHA